MRKSLSSRCAPLSADFSEGRSRNILTATALVLACFALLPVTRYAGNFRDAKRIIRSVDTAPRIPEPMRDPIPPEPPKPPEELKEIPDFMQNSSAMPLTALDISLAPGTGTAIQGAFDMQTFQTGGDELGGIEIFEVSDLDSIPKLRRGAKPRYPPELLKQQIGGMVRLRVMLDECGRVSVMEVLEADRKEFEISAIESVEKLVYDPPMRNGKRVKTQFVLPLRFVPY